jgi:23S rRNA (pseudouridine1915-N3)-methyltransferase
LREKFADLIKAGRCREELDDPMKTALYFFGKPRDAHLNAVAADLIQRANRFAPVIMQEARVGRFDPWAKHPAAQIVLLDPAGRTIDSAAVAQVFRRAEDSGRDLVFVIGPHEGHSAEWRSRASDIWSLSAMTFNHELARAMMAEQIYRAFATLRNHPYVR